MDSSAVDSILQGAETIYEVPMRAPPLAEDVLFGYVGKLFQDGDLVMAALFISRFSYYDEDT